MDFKYGVNGVNLKKERKKRKEAPWIDLCFEKEISVPSWSRSELHLTGLCHTANVIALSDARTHTHTHTSLVV